MCAGKGSIILNVFTAERIQLKKTLNDEFYFYCNRSETMYHTETRHVWTRWIKINPHLLKTSKVKKDSKHSQT